MGGSLDRLVQTYQLQLPHHSFLPEREVGKIVKKVDQKKCSHGLLRW